MTVDDVEAALVRLEARRGGSVHSIRAIPIDMIRDAVAREGGSINYALLSVCQRYDGDMRHSEQLT